jgi:phosphate starvation-inducible protein PhoH and related proteins
MSKKPARTPVAASDRVRLEIEFEKAYLLGSLFGEFDQNLIALEGQLGVYISRARQPRGGGRRRPMPPPAPAMCSPVSTTASLKGETIDTRAMSMGAVAIAV